jgi:hypothetical protein
MWGIPDGGGGADADAGAVIVSFEKVSSTVVVDLLFDFFDFGALLFE